MGGWGGAALCSQGPVMGEKVAERCHLHLFSPSFSSLVSKKTHLQTQHYPGLGSKCLGSNVSPRGWGKVLLPMGLRLV